MIRNFDIPSLSIRVAVTLEGTRIVILCVVESIDTVKSWSVSKLLSSIVDINTHPVVSAIVPTPKVTLKGSGIIKSSPATANIYTKEYVSVLNYDMHTRNLSKIGRSVCGTLPRLLENIDDLGEY